MMQDCALHLSGKAEMAPALKGDLRALAELIIESWRVTYRGIISDDYLDAMSLDQRHERFIEGFDRGSSSFFKLLLEGQLIGAAVFGKSTTEGYEQDGEVSAIYLREEYVGKKLGHMFFVAIEELLKAKGYSRIMVSLLPENERALRFYTQHGYRKVATTALELGENKYPLIILRK